MPPEAIQVRLLASCQLALPQRSQLNASAGKCLPIGHLRSHPSGRWESERESDPVTCDMGSQCAVLSRTSLCAVSFALVLAVKHTNLESRSGECVASQAQDCCGDCIGVARWR